MSKIKKKYKDYTFEKVRTYKGEEAPIGLIYFVVTIQDKVESSLILKDIYTPAEEANIALGLREEAEIQGKV